MDNQGGEMKKATEPVGLQVPELLYHRAGDIALGSGGQDPKETDLTLALGIDRAAVRRHYLEQLALEGIELVD